MTRIMKEYKVEEVTNMVKDKIFAKYLEDELPKLKSDFQKAIREIQKSEEVFIEFVYRLDADYLKKIQPNFDCLSQLVRIVLLRGEGAKASQSLVSLRAQKSFGLYWKSLTKK